VLDRAIFTYESFELTTRYVKIKAALQGRPSRQPLSRPQNEKSEEDSHTGDEDRSQKEKQRG
jgi:hypothetical protein